MAISLSFEQGHQGRGIRAGGGGGEGGGIILEVEEEEEEEEEEASGQRHQGFLLVPMTKYPDTPG